MVLRRFLQHRAAVISGVLLILAILVALVGGRFWKYSYDEFLSVDELSQPPSLEHPMGTTSAGRDSFAQVLRGAQKSVQIALTGRVRVDHHRHADRRASPGSTAASWTRS